MKKAVIIGAGPAGLTAAYELLRKTDIKPIILEESSEIGGISRTCNYKDNRMDIGGHRFFTKNKQVLDLWLELMPLQNSPSLDQILLGQTKKFDNNGRNPELDDDVMLIRRRVSRIFYLRNFFDYPISMRFSTFKNMGFGRTVVAGFGYIYSCFLKREEKSLEDFYINRFGRPLYEMFFEDYTEKLWGIHPSKIAPDWGAQRVKGLSLLKAVLSVLKKPFVKSNKNVETSLIEEFYYPKKGPGQLYKILAQRIVELGGEIHFNTNVDQINLNDLKISSVNAGEKTFDCDYCFSTMPIKDLVVAMKEKAPTNVQQVAFNLPYRDFITVGLLLDKLKLKNKTKIKTVNNIVPDCWIYIQERDVKIGRLQIFNNWSPYMVQDFENKVFIGLEYFCSENDPMWKMSDDEFIDFAIDELVKINIIDREDVLDSVRIKVKKAYPAYFGVYENFDTVIEYLNTIDNLFCIGRNGQHRYNNMDHSMLTAIKAVEVINNKAKKEEIWQVNTEEEYHETKQE